VPRSWVSILALSCFGHLLVLASPMAAQTGSITLHSVDLDFEGQIYTFLPGGDNVFKIPARPPFFRRRGTFSPKATFNAAAGATRKRVIAACNWSTDVDQSGGSWILDEGPWDLDPAGPVDAFSFTNVSMTPRPFQIGGEATAAPEVTYTINCELQKLQDS